MIPCRAAFAALAVLILAACGSSKSAAPPRRGESDPTGSGARYLEFLLAKPYGKLVVEVDYVSGLGPDSSALSLLRQRLEERCFKPGGIVVRVGDAIPAAGLPKKWQVTDLRNLEKAWRNFFPEGDQAALYCIYVGGEFAPKAAVGLSYAGSSVAVFKDVVKQATAGGFSNAAIETSTLVHEAGHALGLVGSPASPVDPNHWDSANGAHCINTLCVMHAGLEANNFTGNASAGTPDNFDLDCIQDLQRAGGR